MAKVNYFQPAGVWFPVQGRIMIVSPLGLAGTVGTTTAHLFWVNVSSATGTRAELQAPAALGTNAPKLGEVGETSGFEVIPGTYCYLTDQADGNDPSGEALGSYISFAD